MYSPVGLLFPQRDAWWRTGGPAWNLGRRMYSPVGLLLPQLGAWAQDVLPGGTPFAAAGRMVAQGGGAELDRAMVPRARPASLGHVAIYDPAPGIRRFGSPGSPRQKYQVYYQVFPQVQMSCPWPAPNTTAACSKHHSSLLQTPQQPAPNTTAACRKHHSSLPQTPQQPAANTSQLEAAAMSARRGGDAPNSSSAKMPNAHT
eukprot:gene12875-biopygen12927